MDVEPRLRRCETCRFWDPEDNGARGRCRVLPPQPNGTWPWTSRNDWCGRYLVNTSVRPLESD